MTPKILLLALCGFLFLGSAALETDAHPGRVDPCNLFGPVFVEEVEGFADYRVFVEDVESFSDLVVFKEQAASFADRSGLWFITDNRAFAKFTVAYTDVRGFADFSVFFSDFKSVAGCQ